VYAHDTGEAGIYAFHADYVTFDHNIAFNNGYNGYGWSSGIGMNVSSHYNDSDTGFHYIFTNNIIAGEYDSSSNHTDGNGMIIDGGYSSQFTPPVLIANNVVYSNGGTCIIIYEQTGGHWLVNNTCYKNALDLQVGGCGFTRGCSNEFDVGQTKNNYVVNNIARAWDVQHPYGGWNSSSNPLDHNLWWGNGSNQLAPYSVVALSQGDPLFVNPPVVSDTVPTSPGEGWFRNALNPLKLGTGLQLQAGSPAIDAGIDPTTLTTNSAIRAALQQWVTTDINGVARPQGKAYDLGAYEYH
jgi:hypothetical protein